jgi:hypothetical protein
VPTPHWEAFGSLVLQAAYEATMAAAVLNAQRGASNVVLLTELGGGRLTERQNAWTSPFFDFFVSLMNRSRTIFLRFSNASPVDGPDDSQGESSRTPFRF